MLQKCQTGGLGLRQAVLVTAFFTRLQYHVLSTICKESNQIVLQNFFANLHVVHAWTAKKFLMAYGHLFVWKFWNKRWRMTIFLFRRKTFYRHHCNHYLLYLQDGQDVYHSCQQLIHLDTTTRRIHIFFLEFGNGPTTRNARKPRTVPNTVDKRELL